MNELSDPEQLIMGVMTLIEENVNENNRLSQRRPVTGVCVGCYSSHWSTMKQTEYIPLCIACTLSLNTAMNKNRHTGLHNVM